MKIGLIALGILFFIIVAIQGFALLNRNKIESYPYKLVKKYNGFEVRNYESSLFTSIKIPTSEYNEASNKGFSVLAGYIFGGNEKQEKIAMTTPVAMNMEDSITMMFMVPKKYKKEDLPKPNRSDITFYEEPSKTVAAIRFGGWANSKKIEKYTLKLKTLLDRENIEYESGHQYLGYNPPYDLIGRRNEIIIQLKSEMESFFKS